MVQSSQSKKQVIDIIIANYPPYDTANNSLNSRWNKQISGFDDNNIIMAQGNILLPVNT